MLKAIPCTVESDSSQQNLKNKNTVKGGSAQFLQLTLFVHSSSRINRTRVDKAGEEMKLEKKQDKGMTKRTVTAGANRVGGETGKTEIIKKG